MHALGALMPSSALRFGTPTPPYNQPSLADQAWQAAARDIASVQDCAPLRRHLRPELDMSMFSGNVQASRPVSGRNFARSAWISSTLKPSCSDIPVSRSISISDVQSKSVVSCSEPKTAPCRKRSTRNEAHRRYLSCLISEVDKFGVVPYSGIRIAALVSGFVPCRKSGSIPSSQKARIETCSSYTAG